MGEYRPRPVTDVSEEFTLKTELANYRSGWAFISIVSLLCFTVFCSLFAHGFFMKSNDLYWTIVPACISIITMSYSLWRFKINNRELKKILIVEAVMNS